MPARDYHSGPKGFDGDPFPQKKRKIQRNLETLDLDEVMAGSDDDDADEPKSAVSSPPSRRSVKVSQRTRDLMSFLDEGPPDSGPLLSRSGRELVDFLAEGPPDAGFSASGYDSGKKGSGRLQRMMSKLSLGNSEKGRQPSEDFNRNSRRSRAPTNPVNSIPAKTSATNLSALANKPIPPRYPPISPPSSPSSEEQLTGTQAINGRKPMPPSWEQNAVSSVLPSKPDPAGNSHSPLVQSPNSRNGADSPKSAPHRSKHGELDSAKQTSDPVVAKRQITKTSTPRNGSARPTDTAPFHVNSNDAQELRRLMARGTTAEECRLLLEMFLAKSNATVESTDYDIPYPSPLSDKPERASQSSDAALENLIVEFFLGGDSSLDPPLRKKRNPTRKKPATPSSPNNGALPLIHTPASEMDV